MLPSSSTRRFALLTFPLALFACGGTTAADSSDAGSDAVATVDAAKSDGPVAPPSPGLPPDPGGPPPDGADSSVFAVRKLFMGDTDRMGVASQTAWKQYGLDIDGKVTTKDSLDVCTLASGASKSTQTDGLHGIDNSWGENILPIWLTTSGQDFASRINAAIEAGAQSMLVRVDHLGAGANYSPLPGAFYAAGRLTPPPAWNGLDVWPVTADSVTGGDVNRPTIAFAGGYMASRVWISGPPVPKLALSFPMGGIDSPIPLAHAQIAMTVSADGSSVADGIIAGVIPTEDYITSLKLIAGRISTSLCNGSAFESIAQQIRQASDVMADGTNGPGRACDAISFAWGFEGKRVKLGAVAPVPTPTPDPCAH